MSSAPMLDVALFELRRVTHRRVATGKPCPCGKSTGATLDSGPGVGIASPGDRDVGSLPGGGGGSGPGARLGPGSSAGVGVGAGAGAGTGAGVVATGAGVGAGAAGVGVGPGTTAPGLGGPSGPGPGSGHGQSRPGTTGGPAGAGPTGVAFGTVEAALADAVSGTRLLEQGTRAMTDHCAPFSSGSPNSVLCVCVCCLS
jgi:hypothetical protein